MQQVYEVIQIAEKFWRIEEGGVQMFLVEGEDFALLIDSGFGGGDLASIVKSITDKPIKLLNTHADKDHIAGNPQFGTPYMHPSEVDYAMQKNPDIMKGDFLPVWEGDIFDLGHRKFEVILIPGHTPGSIALLDRANKVLISGDSLSYSPIFMFGPGRNIHAYITSMQKLQAIGGFETVLPSHGPIPIDANTILPKLIEGALKLKEGALMGVKPEREVPALLYTYQDIGFLA